MCRAQQHRQSTLNRHMYREANQLLGNGLTHEEVTKQVTNMSARIHLGRVSDEDISRWVAEECEAKTALSGLHNTYLCEELTEA